MNLDGTVDLISDKPTFTEVYFQGERGYNNGVYLLNDYCKTMYSNSLLNAKARSLNIEDIEKKMKVVNEEIQKKLYENYTSNTETVYGTTYTYSENTWYPSQWKEDNEILERSIQTEIKTYTSEEDAKK